MARSIYDLRKGKNADDFYPVLKLKAGHYTVFSNRDGYAAPIGEIYKRYNDWYGELTVDGLFFNACGDSLKDVIEELESGIVRNGQGGRLGDIYQKDAAEWTANLMERLKNRR